MSGPQIGELDDEKPNQDDPYMSMKDVSQQSSLSTNTLIFSGICAMCIMASGGLILGVGPFIERLIADGYFEDRCDPGESGCSEQYDAISVIFNGGFQMMTWGSCIAGILLNVWGPRVNATLGLTILTVGCFILSMARTEDGPYVFMMGYGFIGIGGNFNWISSFHYVNLFPKNAIPVAIAIFSGVFNVSGLVFILLNIPGLTIKKFFTGYTLLGLFLTMLVAIVTPNLPLSPDKQYKLSVPSLRHVNCAAFKDLLKPEIIAAVTEKRWIWFSILFSWTTMAGVVIGGLVNNLISSKTDDEHTIHIFNDYVYPALGSSTFIFTPFVGKLINQSGFHIPMLLLVIITQMTIVLCWAPTVESQYVMLICFNLIQAFAYTMQFAYIQLTYPANFYGPLIAAIIAAQGLVGLIAWPGLSPNPFGPTAFTPVLLILLIPSFVLYYAPYQQYPHDKEQLGPRKMKRLDDSSDSLEASSMHL